MNVRVRTSEALYDDATAAFYKAAEETRDQAVQNAAGAPSHNPKTGTLATTIKMWRRQRKDRPTATIGSRKSPYVTVMEFGGGPHAGWDAKGPHVQRNRAPRFIGRAMQEWPEAYLAALGKGPRISSHIYSSGRGSGGSVVGIMTSR